MVVDTSALVAVLAAAPRLLVSAASLVGTGIVVDGRLGTGLHPARLNFGDRSARSLARTDVEPALAPG